ncbi:hypothetical protein HOY80DRAFT_1044657 [Tuber brumale]|nr:hypothetical protein HOY80DRAFT_1044657 [Tuber brumale]
MSPVPWRANSRQDHAETDLGSDVGWSEERVAIQGPLKDEIHRYYKAQNLRMVVLDMSMRRRWRDAVARGDEEA